MAALKKAYADIILNTAKESAARILMSERKALCFQQNLFLSKEQALHTLLRLKNIMDSKNNEAGWASLGQARRIQELEIQIAEAEDTIKHLRTELKKVNFELETIKYNLAEPSDKQNRSCHASFDEDACQQNKHTSDSVLGADSMLGSVYGPEEVDTSVLKSSTLNQQTADGRHCFMFENATHAEPLEDLPAENSYADPDLASIIMRSKEPELNRNGCTQRIWAFEQNVLTGRVPSGNIDEQLSKNDLVICENERAEKPCNMDSPKVDNKMIQAKNPDESKETVEHVGHCETGQVIKFFCRQSPREQRSRCKRMRTTTRGSSDPDTSAKDESSVLLKCENVVPSQSVKRDAEDQISKINPLSMENIENENIARAPLSLSRNDVDFAVHVAENVLISGGYNLQPEEEQMVSTPDQKVTGNSDASVCKVNLERSDVPLMNSDSKNGKICESSGAPAQASNDRHLKYTFTRKRKRISSSKINENVLPEKDISKRIGQKQSALPEPRKPSLVIESSRDSRRLVQVARQLISLSAKRW